MTIEIPAGRLEQLRQTVPDVAGKMAQIIVDNPAQFALVAAGSVVATRAAVNLVRPRTAVEGLALLALLQLGLPHLASLAVRRGWLTFRVRDEEGHLVPLVIDAGQPDPA